MARRRRSSSARSAASVAGSVAGSVSDSTGGHISPWPFVGMAGMACVFFLYAASGLLAPVWAVVLLLAIWAGALFVCTAWWNLHPTWVPWVPVFLAVFWFAAMNAGGAWLGWTA